MTFPLDPQGLHGWLAGFSFVLGAAVGSAQAQPILISPAGSSSDAFLVAYETDLASPAQLKVASALNCPLQPAYPLPADAASLERLLLLLDAHAPDCLNSAGFHAWRGAVLLSSNRPAPAIESLERALLINPDLPGAQLDYAAALLAVGDQRSARELLLQLDNRQDLPLKLRELLSKELEATDPDLLRSRWLLSSAVGVDSNLNNAPSASELTLTFPQGSLTLPLLDSSRPKRGSAAFGVAQWQGLKPQGSQLWLFQADLRARHTPEAATRYQQADISATWLQAQDSPQQWVARAGASQINFGGQKLLQSARVSMQRQWRGEGLSSAARQCRPSAGIEVEGRRFPISSSLDGNYAGVIAVVVCADTGETPNSVAGHVINFQIRTGSDRASSLVRPGGNFARTELRASWEKPFGLYKLNGDFGFSRQVDASGYSPLLSDNLVRKISRHSLRAELSHPLGMWANADWFVIAEFNVQYSNLEAFRSRQNAFYSGVRWSIQ